MEAVLAPRMRPLVAWVFPGIDVTTETCIPLALPNDIPAFVVQSRTASVRLEQVRAALFQAVVRRRRNIHSIDVLSGARRLAAAGSGKTEKYGVDRHFSRFTKSAKRSIWLR